MKNRMQILPKSLQLPFQIHRSAPRSTTKHRILNADSISRNLSNSAVEMSPIVSLILFAAFISAQSDLLIPAGEKRSAYDIIKDYNFPVGILPIGVRDYELDAATGKFAAFYNKTCSFSLEGSYQLQYKSTIRGVISKNRLTNLEGVKVKLWFVWVDIVEVSRKDDNLYFSVGIAGADFAVDNFEECPQCGCGLNCGNNEETEKLDLVSSY